MSTPDDASSAADAAEDEVTASPKRVSKKAKTWGWVGVGVLVAITCMFGWQAFQDPVRWNDVGFSIDSPTSAEATFDVYLYKNSDAICHLRALNDHFAEVGVADVTVKVREGRQQRVTAQIVTTDEATTAVVRYCEAAK